MALLLKIALESSGGESLCFVEAVVVGALPNPAEAPVYTGPPRFSSQSFRGGGVTSDSEQDLICGQARDEKGAWAELVFTRRRWTSKGSRYVKWVRWKRTQLVKFHSCVELNERTHTQTKKNGCSKPNSNRCVDVDGASVVPGGAGPGGGAWTKGSRVRRRTEARLSEASLPQCLQRSDHNDARPKLK